MSQTRVPFGRGCNRRASSVQENPSKPKEKHLVFLGFRWPNWDFSEGYGRKNKKIDLPSNSRVELWGGAHTFYLPPLASSLQLDFC